MWVGSTSSGFQLLSTEVSPIWASPVSSTERQAQPEGDSSLQVGHGELAPGSRDNSTGCGGSLDTPLQPDRQSWGTEGRENPPQEPGTVAGTDPTEGAFN